MFINLHIENFSNSPTSYYLLYCWSLSSVIINIAFEKFQSFTYTIQFSHIICKLYILSSGFYTFYTFVFSITLLYHELDGFVWACFGSISASALCFAAFIEPSLVAVFCAQICHFIKNNHCFLLL